MDRFLLREVSVDAMWLTRPGHTAHCHGFSRKKDQCFPLSSPYFPSLVCGGPDGDTSALTAHGYQQQDDQLVLGASTTVTPPHVMSRNHGDAGQAGRA